MKMLHHILLHTVLHIYVRNLRKYSAYLDIDNYCYNIWIHILIWSPDTHICEKKYGIG